MEAVSARKFLQVWMWVLVIVSLLAIPQTIQQTNELQIIILRSKWIGLVGIFALTAVAGLWLSRSSLLGRMAVWMDGFERQSPNALRFLSGVMLTLFGFLLVWFTRLYIFGSVLPQLMPILWVFLWASLLQVFGLKLLKNTLKWHTAFGIVLLAQGVLFQAYGFLSSVSSDPFSIGYSEAGRHYYASMFFAKSVYGVS
ncbi:MAG: hypothetical protein Q8M03_05375, partial [Legionella sp.]|nr:hypothetical protein [Legionella sp.]